MACGDEDVFSEQVVQCPTLKELGVPNDGMMDCEAEGQVVEANAAQYVCDDCRQRKLRYEVSWVER